MSKQLADIRLRDGESLIEAIHDLRIRVEALEGNLVPAQQRAGYEPVSGSGSERWPDGADHWTQTGNGTDYPGSYGVGPEETDGLIPFVPLSAPIQSDGLAVGDSFRIIRADQSVDPAAHVATAIANDLVTYEAEGETLEVSLGHVVKVTP